MFRRTRIKIPLARKIGLLFGTAVLLTISVTLLFPHLQMTALNEEQMLMQARWVASSAYQAADLNRSDWTKAQSELEEIWPLFVRRLGLPRRAPHFVATGPAPPRGFRKEAMDRLSGSATQQYFWKLQDNGRIFRFALAIRGHEADPHPQALRGIIDVKLPVPPAIGVWNSVTTVLAGASGAVLAILVFYVVTQRLVLTPLFVLRRAAEKVATGDINVRSVISSGDEFQDLSEAFNEMLSHLNRAQEDLRKTNRSLDIRLGELAETNVALYESNRLKGEFLANVTHELRTPLVSIIGFAELLRDAWETTDFDRVRLARYTGHILSSGRSLLEIINDLLDLTKIEAGKMELHLSDFSIEQLCHELIDFVRPLADKREQTLELTVDLDSPEFHSDAGKIRQILYNLLSNAIKFNTDGGSVSLDIERCGARGVRLSISDTGPGIPEDQHEAVFEKFSQLDASKTREHEGTGLGLAITRELVHVLGGTIRLDTNVSVGATFVIELDVIVPAPAPRPSQT